MGVSAPTWYRTDNAGRVFAWSAGARLRNLFRLSITLRRPIQVELLQAALEAVLPRFPLFAVHVRRGVFWTFLQVNRARPQVLADDRFPCQYLPVHPGQAFPFRVRAFHRRIALEVSHILTDGTGAARFLCSLTAEYLRRREGLVPAEPGDLMLAGQAVDPEEVEDAFRRCHSPGLPGPEPRPAAWHLPQTEDHPEFLHLTSGRIPTADLKAQARPRGVTVTEFLAAVHLDVLQSLYEWDPPRRRRPICLDIPVDLRRVWPSRTVRNFFVTIQARIDPRLGHYPFGQILETVQCQVRHQRTDKELRRLVARNVGAERHPLLRLIPGPVKGRVIPLIYRRVSLRTSTSTLSNLGRITLPAPLDTAVERVDLVPLHPNLRKIGCTCIGFGEHLVITFARTLREPIVERLFFRALVERGCRVQIESNAE